MHNEENNILHYIELLNQLFRLDLREQTSVKM